MRDRPLYAAINWGLRVLDHKNSGWPAMIAETFYEFKQQNDVFKKT